MPKKTFTINSFQDMYFDTRRNNSDWKLEPRNQPERTLAPVMRTKQLDDISTKSKGNSHSVTPVDKKQYGFLPNTDVLKYTVDNSGASELGGSGQGSGMRETSTMPRVRVIPVRKPQNPIKEHNVEWLDKMSIRKSFAIPRVSIKLNGAESTMLVPHRDYNDSFFKRVTPGDGHRPLMRHKLPGEGLSKIPISDLPTKPFFTNSPKRRKNLRQPAAPKKKSFSLSADIYDKAYKSLYKKFIGQLVADHKDEVLRDAAETWRYKGFSDEEVVSEWGALSTFLDKASKEQFIGVLKSYKRQLGETKTSNSNGLDPAPYYGDTNVYPYKGTGPAMGPSSHLEVMLNPIQMRDTQVNNRQLTRILGDSKEAISYTEESLKKSLDELDADTALQWIGNAGGKMKLLHLLKNLTENFAVTMPQKAFDAIDEAYKRWKDIPSSRSLSGAKKSFAVTTPEKKSFMISKVAYIKKLTDQEKWRVYSESGKNMGTYDSMSGAKDRLKDIEFFKHKKSFVISAMTYDEYIESGKGYKVSESDAKRIADDLEVNLNKISFDQFRIGISIEMEHGSTDPKTNVIDDDKDLSNDLVNSAKIALAHLNEVSDYYDKLITYVEARKSFKIITATNRPVSDDVYDAFTEKGYAFKNYQLSADQINEAIDHGKDLSLLLKYQELTDRQKLLTINKAIDKKVALVYIYEEEKSHLNENQLTALLTALYDKAEQDGTNLQYVLKNFDLDPEKKNKLIMKGLTEGIGLHYLFKSGLLNIEQREFAVKKSIETGFGLLDLLKFERLNEEQKSKIINKAIERGVALIYILRKENVTEEQKKQIFEKAMAEGKGYYYLLKRFKLKPEQLKMAINKSKHSIENLEYILKFQDLVHDQKVYVEKKLDALKEKKRETREKELEKKRQSSKDDLFVVPGSEGFKDLQEFFRYADKSAVTEMYKLLKDKNFDDAEELLGEWDIDEIL